MNLIPIQFNLKRKLNQIEDSSSLWQANKRPKTSMSDVGEDQVGRQYFDLKAFKNLPSTEQSAFHSNWALLENIQKAVLEKLHLLTFYDLNKNFNINVNVSNSSYQVVFKTNESGTRGFLETNVYQLATLCGKADLVVPVRPINFKVGVKEYAGAIQIYKNDVNLKEFFPIENDLSSLNAFEKQIQFKSLAKAIIFEMVFGMSDCIPENLLYHTDGTCSNFIHFDNELSLFSMENENDSLFKSCLLLFSHNYKELSLEDINVIKNELKIYLSSFDSMVEFLKNYPYQSKLQTEKIISFLRFRLASMKHAFTALERREIHTMAEFVLYALPAFRKIVYFKIALELCEKTRSSDTIDFQSILRTTLGDQSSYGDDLTELKEELDTLLQNSSMSVLIETQWMRFHPQKFMQTVLSSLPKSS